MYYLKFIRTNDVAKVFINEEALERWLSKSDVYTTQGIFAYNHFCRFMLAMHPNECTGRVVIKPQVNAVYKGTEEEKKTEYKTYKLFLASLRMRYNNADTASQFLQKELKTYVGDKTTDFMLYMRNFIISDEEGRIYDYMCYIDKRRNELYKRKYPEQVNEHSRLRTYITDGVCENKLHRYHNVLDNNETANITNKTIYDEETDTNIKGIRAKRRQLKDTVTSPSGELFKDNITWKRNKKRKQWMHGTKQTVTAQGSGKWLLYNQYYNTEYGEIDKELCCIE